MITEQLNDVIKKYNIEISSGETQEQQVEKPSKKEEAEK